MGGVVWMPAEGYGAMRAEVDGLVLSVWPVEVRGGRYGRRARVVSAAGWAASVWRREGAGSLRRVWDDTGILTAALARRAAEHMARRAAEHMAGEHHGAE